MYTDDNIAVYELIARLFVVSVELFYLELKSAERKDVEREKACVLPLGKRADYAVNAFTLFGLILQIGYRILKNFDG